MSHIMDTIRDITEKHLRMPVSTVPIGVGDTTLKNYLAVQNEDGQVVSIVSPRYKLVPNATVIDNIEQVLSDMKITYYVNDHMTYAYPNKMRYVIQLPDLHIKDDSEKGMSLALSVHNSYDGKTPVKFDWMMYRYVCLNGAKTFVSIKSIKKKHYKELKMDEVFTIFEDAQIKIESIEARIRKLQNINTIPWNLMESIEEKFPRMVENITRLSSPPNNLWDLYNTFTHYISHNVPPRSQEMYLQYLNQSFTKHTKEYA